jgi:hypothetical protein
VYPAERSEAVISSPGHIQRFDELRVVELKRLGISMTNEAVSERLRCVTRTTTCGQRGCEVCLGGLM